MAFAREDWIQAGLEEPSNTHYVAQFDLTAAPAPHHQMSSPTSASVTAAALKQHAAQNLELVISTLEGSLSSARSQLLEAHGEPNTAARCCVEALRLAAALKLSEADS